MSETALYVAEIKRLNEEIRALQKTIERSRDFWFSLVERIPAQVYLQRKDYTIEYANRKFVELYGNYKNKKCYHVIHGRTTPCETCKTFEVFETGVAQIWEDIHDEGAAVNLIYDYPFTNDNGDDLVLEMGIDITETYGNEQRRKNLFANVSHELRTPMTKIMGYAEAMLELPNEEKNFYAECIHKNAQVMNKLIEDLFELAKVEISQSFEIEPVDLAPILSEYLEEQLVYYTDKAVNFSYRILSATLVAKVDVNRLMQVVSNLIGNAYDHAGAARVIHVRVSVVGEEADIEVFNKGGQIRTQDMNYLFHRYYQADTRGNKSEHLGIGLSICKNIVEKMQGKIWAENVDGFGVAFHIRLPLARG